MKTKRFPIPRLKHPYSGSISDRLHVLSGRRSKLDELLRNETSKHFPKGTAVIIRHTRRDDVGKFVGVEAEILEPLVYGMPAALIEYRTEPDLETVYRTGRKVIHLDDRPAWVVDWYYIDLPSDWPQHAELLAGRGYVDVPTKPKRKPRRKGAVRR